MVGVCTSRPLHFYYYGSGADRCVRGIYFVDYLCVDRAQPLLSDVRRSLFQTHDYHIRSMNPDYPASLIRQESNLAEGVVALVEYRLYTFRLRTISPHFPGHIQLVEIGKENVDILHNLWNQFPQLMCDLVVCPDIGGIIGQTKTRGLRVFALKSKGDVMGIYFLKNTRTFYEEFDGKNTIECIASICNSPDIDMLFNGGFQLALIEMLKNNGSDFGLLNINDLGHNHHLLTGTKLIMSEPIFTIKTQYITHNLIIPKSPLNPQKCLFLI